MPDFESILAWASVLIPIRQIFLTDAHVRCRSTILSRIGHVWLQWRYWRTVLAGNENLVLACGPIDQTLPNCSRPLLYVRVMTHATLLISIHISNLNLNDQCCSKKRSFKNNVFPWDKENKW
jgi:hypothetical protein